MVAKGLCKLSSALHVLAVAVLQRRAADMRWRGVQGQNMPELCRWAAFTLGVPRVVPSSARREAGGA